MGNGVALGAVVAKREIVEAFCNGMEYFNTFGGSNLRYGRDGRPTHPPPCIHPPTHPPTHRNSCAIGEAVLDIMEEEGLQENARVVGDYLKTRLLALQQTTHPPLIGDVRGLGLFLGVELVKDVEKRTPWAEAADWVAGRAKELGVQVSTDGPEKNVLKIKPPLCFGRKEADVLVGALAAAMRDFWQAEEEKKKG